MGNKTNDKDLERAGEVLLDLEGVRRKDLMNITKTHYYMLEILKEITKYYIKGFLIAPLKPLGLNICQKRYATT